MTLSLRPARQADARHVALLMAHRFYEKLGFSRTAFRFFWPL
jgi:predicted N-acetyltransferase YhbS